MAEPPPRRAEADDLAHDGAVSNLYFTRRYCAKLLYEIEFFQADDPRR